MLLWLCNDIGGDADDGDQGILLAGDKRKDKINDGNQGILLAGDKKDKR